LSDDNRLDGALFRKPGLPGAVRSARRDAAFSAAAAIATFSGRFVSFLLVAPAKGE